MTKDSISTLYDLFADLLDYPTLATSLKAGHCYARLQQSQPEAASLMESFYQTMELRSLGQMQELYTNTFDMQPVCYPYVGYQLFGESYKRGDFMAQLNEAYHANSYSAGQELPDHLAVILRFLGLEAARRQDDFGRALLIEGVVLALRKMAESLSRQGENPYAGIVSALLLTITDTPEKEVQHEHA
jgi:nitrate reductase molybdenum cofactor assembly chaperone NarJ/NarW